jgi:hypothetical protein
VILGGIFICAGAFFSTPPWSSLFEIESPWFVWLERLLALACGLFWIVKGVRGFHTRWCPREGSDAPLS